MIQAEKEDEAVGFLSHRLYVIKTLVPSGYEPYFRERARYLSAHTSARVEGNPLNEAEALVILSGDAEPDGPAEIEVSNLQAAYELMEQLAEDASARIDQGLIRAMNSVILKDLPPTQSRRRGQYRLGPSLIVDSSDRRTIRYRPPQPAWIPDLMAGLVDSIQDWLKHNTHPPPVVAALAHFGLVSIHPFEDGNGRTARLLADMILRQTDWCADGMLSVNQVIFNERDSYYEGLREAQGLDFKLSVDVTPFVRFHMTALGKAAAALEDQAVAFSQRLDHLRSASSHALNERQTLALMYMIDVRPLSTSMYARLTDSSQSSAYADLVGMVNQGFVVRRGKGRNTRYAIREGLFSTDDDSREKPR
ncbi:MAG: Fic family protein [Chloroflexi bacterium]|nr:Fic family protein [Chloroflexota bacterium]